MTSNKGKDLFNTIPDPEIPKFEEGEKTHPSYSVPGDFREKLRENLSQGNKGGTAVMGSNTSPFQLEIIEDGDATLASGTPRGVRVMNNIEAINKVKDSLVKSGYQDWPDENMVVNSMQEQKLMLSLNSSIHYQFVLRRPNQADVTYNLFHQGRGSELVLRSDEGDAIKLSDMELSDHPDLATPDFKLTFLSQNPVDINVIIPRVELQLKNPQASLILMKS